MHIRYELVTFVLVFKSDFHICLANWHNRGIFWSKPNVL